MTGILFYAICGRRILYFLRLYNAKILGIKFTKKTK